jgi:hypothetical protein
MIGWRKQVQEVKRKGPALFSAFAYAYLTLLSAHLGMHGHEISVSPNSHADVDYQNGSERSLPNHASHSSDSPENPMGHADCQLCIWQSLQQSGTGPVCFAETHAYPSFCFNPQVSQFIPKPV